MTLMGNTGEAASINQKLANRYDKWLLAQGYALLTRRRYNAVVTSFLAFLGDRLATKTTQIEMQDYLAAGAANGWASYRLRGHLYSCALAV
jgi:hypothetical protein